MLANISLRSQLLSLSTLCLLIISFSGVAFTLHIHQQIEQLTSLATDTTPALSANLDNLKSSLWLALCTTLALCLISLLLLSQWASARLYRPLQNAIKSLSTLSNQSVQAPNEISQIQAYLRALQERLSHTSSSLERSGTQLHQASDELKLIAHDMSQGIEEQGLRTDQVATAMEEMTAAAQEVAGHTLRAAKAADDAEQATQEGESAMVGMVNSINHIRNEIGKTADVIHDLENESTRISEVLAVIHSIAEQTNLLALNAAIEAARAGETGRGFAVVADEVRNLAQRTAQSTAEINTIICAVQKSAQSAVKAIDSGKRSSEQGVEQVQLAGQILNGVTDAVQTIRDMSQQIATAAEEQTLVAEDISRNLTDLVMIASNNQHNVSRTQQASLQLDDLSRNLSELQRQQ